MTMRWKLLFPGLHGSSKQWKLPQAGRSAAKPPFAIVFGDTFPRGMALNRPSP